MMPHSPWETKAVKHSRLQYAVIPFSGRSGSWEETPGGKISIYKTFKVLEREKNNGFLFFCQIGGFTVDLRTKPNSLVWCCPQMKRRLKCVFKTTTQGKQTITKVRNGDLSSWSYSVSRLRARKESHFKGRRLFPSVNSFLHDCKIRFWSETL